jgi:NitT/TauT family transport system substrate-binding protein
MSARLLAALAAACMLAVAGCGSDDDGGDSNGSAAKIPSKPESGTFRMGIEPWLGYGPWRIAEQNGLLKRNGVDVKITNFTTDDQINAAFAARKLDGTNIATHTALRFAAQGLPIKIVLLEDVSTKADAIVAGPGIASIADLKGKKVAFEEGTTSDILLRYALSQNGMSIDDVKKVPLPAADAGAAALAGRVDAAVTYEPYLTTALKRDKRFKLLYTAGEKPGLISDVLVVSEDTLKQRPGQILALVKSWNEALQAYKKDPDGGQAIITKSVGAKPGDLKTAFEGVTFYDLAANRTQLDGEFSGQTIQDVLKTAKDAGLVEGDVDPADIIDTRFVEQAAAAK